MILCLCNGVSDREVMDKAKEGKSVKEIQKETGAGTDCGACLMECKRVYRESKGICLDKQ